MRHVRPMRGDVMGNIVSDLVFFVQTSRNIALRQAAALSAHGRTLSFLLHN
jgi:hypothetical protein